jgi:hypothetical protein
MRRITLSKLVRDWVKSELADSGFTVIKGDWIVCGCKTHGSYEKLGSIGPDRVWLHKPPIESEAKLMSLQELFDNLTGFQLHCTSPTFFPDLRRELLGIHSRHTTAWMTHHSERHTHEA